MPNAAYECTGFILIPLGVERPCPHGQVMELHPYPYHEPHPLPHCLYPCLCPLTHPVPSLVDPGGVWGLCLLLGVPQRLTPLDLAHCSHMLARITPIYNHAM